MSITQLDAYPRLPLAEYPTPLEPLPRLSEQLGRRVYIKRDDGIGPGMGGNKCRKLEYLMADARAHGARRIVTFGGLQSNHARMTAAAAQRFGMEAHLFYFARRPATFRGNLLLNELLGANLHFIPFGSGGDGEMTLETANRLVKYLATLRLGRHYFIPVGGHSWLGCLGYVRAAAEIDSQARQMGIGNAWLLTAAGTGGTLAGLMVGLQLVRSALQPLAIDIGNLWKSFSSSIANMANEICHRLGAEQQFSKDQVPLIQSEYVGEGYGVPSQACKSAIRRLARAEGLLLDPIYTGKAFAGLVDLISKRQLGDEQPIIFLHTGGLPGLFALGDELIR